MGLFDSFKMKQESNAELRPSSIESTLLEIIRLHAPIKARQIITMLMNDFGLKVEKAELNSVLYKMKASGTISQNGEYQWSIASSPHKNKIKSTAPPTLPEIQSEIPEIIFTVDQKWIIDLAPTGNLLIRGQAGCGKTTVLAARAGRILSVTGKGSMLFLTYNAALCSYVKKAFKAARLNTNIEVYTYHDWAKRTAKLLGYDFNGWVDNQTKLTILENIIDYTQTKYPNHRLLQWKTTPEIQNWWDHEISWMFGYGLTTCDDYLKAERVGRGNAVRLSHDDRQLIWTIFESYNQRISADNHADYDDAGGIVIKALNQSNGILPDKVRADHVFVDEVQDFHQSWLMALSPIPRVSLTLAGDLAQKIYKRNFTWKSVGIDIHGSRSKHLTGSHRTTRQVMEVALHIAKNTDIASSDDYVAPTLPSRNGLKVRRITRPTVRAAYDDGYQYILDNFKRLRVKSIAIALPLSRQTYGAQKQLEDLGANITVAKGAKLGQLSSGITVTTFHQLKGLEFDHVVLMGLDDQNFPGRFLEKVDNQDLPEEELSLRRLLYVAMTRAKESLTIVGGGTLCRFLKDIPDNLFEEY
jgi:superfamily I DNA/RNA helicase